MTWKNELRKLAVDLFDNGVIKPGTPKTPIYIDYKQLLSHPQLLANLSTMLWLLIDPGAKYDKVCGVPFDACSRCGVPYTAITYAYEISKQTGVQMLMRRQRDSQIVLQGHFKVDDRVAIVDDEITTGSNILEIAVDLAKEKMKIGEALVVIDREQGGRENLENAGVKVKSLFRFRELIGYLREAGKIPVYTRATRNHTSNVIQFAAREMMSGYPMDTRSLYVGLL